MRALKRVATQLRCRATAYQRPPLRSPKAWLNSIPAPHRRLGAGTGTCNTLPMCPDPTSRESALARLADHLDAARELISAHWVDLLRADPSIPTCALGERALIDDLPDILDDLSQTLRRRTLSVAEQSGEDAAKHGVTRWNQGFDPGALRREFAHLSAALAVQLTVFEERHPHLFADQRNFARSTVQGFLAATMEEAAMQFAARQKGQAGAV